MNTEEGRENYNELRKRTDVTIINEKDHWEQGQLRRFIEYDKTVHMNPKQIDLDKKNGIPSKAGQNTPGQRNEEKNDENDDDEEGLFPENEPDENDTFDDLSELADDPD